MIKPLLLKQEIISGIGNIIAAEALWQAKIYPKERAENLNRRQLSNLFNSIKRVLKLGIKTQGTTMRDWIHPDGQSGKFQNYLKIYGRTGKKCKRCRATIQKLVVAGRGTYICPLCQKRQ